LNYAYTNYNNSLLRVHLQQVLLHGADEVPLMGEFGFSVSAGFVTSVAIDALYVSSALLSPYIMPQNARQTGLFGKVVLFIGFISLLSSIVIVKAVSRLHHTTRSRHKNV
jgi:hypothetical protein